MNNEYYKTLKDAGYNYIVKLERMPNPDDWYPAKSLISLRKICKMSVQTANPVTKIIDLNTDKEVPMSIVF